MLSGLTIVLACWFGSASVPWSGAGLSIPEESRDGAAGLRRPGLGGTFAAEWRRVLSDRSVLRLFVLAPVLYAVFYPQPYLGQIVRNVPIAVVDHDNSELCPWIDADAGRRTATSE